MTLRLDFGKDFLIFMVGFGMDCWGEGRVDAIGVFRRMEGIAVRSGLAGADPALRWGRWTGGPSYP